MDIVEKLTEFIAALPLLLEYIIYGGVFFVTFRFSRLEKVPLNSEHEFIKILLSGYILKMIYLLIPFNTKYEKYEEIITFFLSAILGFVVAKILNRKSVIWFLHNVLKIYRSTGSSFWSDIFDKKDPTIAIFTNENTKIRGKIKEIEITEENPKILLSEYYIEKTDNTGTKIKTSYTDTDRENIIIDTSEYKNIRLQYYWGKFQRNEIVYIKIGKNTVQGKIIEYKHNRYIVRYKNSKSKDRDIVLKETNIFKHQLNTNAYIISKNDVLEIKIMYRINSGKISYYFTKHPSKFKFYIRKESNIFKTADIAEKNVK